MLKIRLRQTGTKNQKKYRIVAMEEGMRRDGQAKEVLGSYDPTVKPPAMIINRDRVKYWVSVGAQMTDAVKKLLETK